MSPDLGDRTTQIVVVVLAVLAIVAILASGSMTDLSPDIVNPESEGDRPASNDTSRTELQSADTDGDGLNDYFEQSILGTDPSVRDTDGDGTSDAAEDHDDDRLTAREEQREGSDPHAPDSDGDDLNDSIELALETNVSNPDTDGDRLSDSYEVSILRTDPTSQNDASHDHDGDGLSTLQEQRIGSIPTLPDSDGDELNDSVELQMGTEIMTPDSDGDGLEDGIEITEPYETDPLVADTDRDGTVDGDERYTHVHTDSSLGTTVAVTGNGTAGSRVRIRDGTRAIFQNPTTRSAKVSPYVEVTSEQSFESATVTIQYDESLVSDENESDIRMVRVNESLQTFVPVESAVDTDANTVSATVSTFSTFVLFHDLFG
ncbi:MAG: hypothetical protein U5K37_12405 [Natrialbaceae archaeon]|nr:hypothetical protein [Natrialbaceae archaeon]